MKVLVFGYSDNVDRYSNMAFQLLKEYQHEAIAINPRIEGDLLNLDNAIHTLTLYVNPGASAKFETLLIAMRPKRVIFNPGTENLELQRKFEAAGSEVVIGCTLVMLKTGQF